MLFQPGDENHRLALPHKLFDCMLAGLPVIAPTFAEEVAAVVRDAACGVLVDSADPGAIAAAVTGLGTPARRAAMGESGRRAALGRFGWAGEATRLVSLYRRLAPFGGARIAAKRNGPVPAHRSTPSGSSPDSSDHRGWPLRPRRPIASRMARRRTPHRILLNLALDTVLAALALPAALLLVAAPWPSESWWYAALPGAIAALLSAAFAVRLPQQYWRYAGLPDLLGVVVAAACGAAMFWGGLLALGAERPANPAFPVIHALALAVLLGLPRVAARIHHGRRGPDTGAEPQSVLLIGAGDGADLFIRALAGERPAGYRVVGILSMRSRQAGRRIRGHPILGTVDEIPTVLEAMRQDGRLPALIVLTTRHVQGLALQRLVDAADRHGVPVRRAPSVTSLDPAAQRRDDLLEEGAAPRLQLREVGIEELLDRPQVPLDREGMARLVQGRRVLVTGAGGTIGGELARQVAALGPGALFLLDHGEYVLYEIDLELRETHPDVPRRAILADVRDESRIRRLFEEIAPELVFHAAALKHVPMVENDPAEGLLTNSYGTRVVADAARAVGTSTMVFISTDKAVNPSSVMGASKRLAEMYCQALDVQARAAGGGDQAAPGRERCAASPCASATCSAPPAAWCRCSDASWSAAARSPSPTPTCAATS